MFSNPTDIIKQCGVSPGAIAGDFGVGEGAYARALAEYVGEHGAVYAFDVQKNLITRLTQEVQSKKNTVIHPVWADLEVPRSSTLADNTLDLAVAANILFQVEHKEILMHEIARVLRPGGRLLVVDWKDSFAGMGPQSTHVVSPARTQELCRTVALVFDKEIHAGEHHYGFLFRKSL